MGVLKTPSEMKTAIVNAFAANKNIDTLFTTPDGNCFTEEHFANFHAAKYQYKITNEIRKDYSDEIALAELTAKAKSTVYAKAQADKALENKTAADKKAADFALKITADLKAEALLLGIELEDGESDDDLKALIADAKKEAAGKGKQYASMKYDALKAECDSRIPAIVYEGNVKKTKLIELLTAADAAV